jgi:hypothetical protein
MALSLLKMGITASRVQYNMADKDPPKRAATSTTSPRFITMMGLALSRALESESVSRTPAGTVRYCMSVTQDKYQAPSIPGLPCQWFNIPYYGAPTPHPRAVALRLDPGPRSRAPVAHDAANLLRACHFRGVAFPVSRIVCQSCFFRALVALIAT